MVTERFAITRAAEHRALVAALAEAGAWCDVPENREPLAALLCTATYLNVPARVLLPALLGRFDCGFGRIEPAPDFVVFHRGGANVPALPKAAGLQQELVKAGILPENVNRELPRQLFREDLYREAVPPPAGPAS